MLQALQELTHLYNELKPALDRVLALESGYKDIKQGPPGLPGRSIKGDKGDPGKSIVHEEVVADVVKKISQPEVLQDHLKVVAGMVLANMPKVKGKRGKRGADGKGVDADTMRAVVEQIAAARKIRPEHIEGLEQTLSALRNAQGMRGGGDTVAAGSNITITYSNGKAIISSTGGGANVTVEELAPTTSGSNITLNLAQLTHTFTAVLGVWKNGQLLTKSDATFGWSRSGNTITVLNATTDDQFQVQYTYA